MTGNAVGTAPSILLCSAWQTVNIRDIAHTPRELALFQEYLPEAEVTLWPHSPLTPEIESSRKTAFHSRSRYRSDNRGFDPRKQR
jgi:hypothetical protein